VKRIGYARVSTEDQDLSLQLDALEAAGCDRIYREKASGWRTDRPALAEALDWARKGDVLVVWKLDRLGRSLVHLVETVQQLQARGVGFVSLTENMDTTSAGGQFILHVFAAQAQFARALTIERTRAGLAAARARGRVGGRPPALTPAQLAEVRRMIGDGRTKTEVARLFDVSRRTVHRVTEGT
jgi:DNA invertase Pin-like site-specific DNA recombinase